MAFKGPFFPSSSFSPESYAFGLQNLHDNLKKKPRVAKSFLSGKRIVIQRMERRKPATLPGPSFFFVEDTHAYYTSIEVIEVPGEAERAKDHPPNTQPSRITRTVSFSQQSNPVCLMSSTSASCQGCRQAQNRTCTGCSPSSTPATHINLRALNRLGASLWTIPCETAISFTGQVPRRSAPTNTAGQSNRTNCRY